MSLKVLVFAGFILHGSLSAQADDYSRKESSYQSGADPEYVSDDFKFSYPKSWSVYDLGEGEGAGIDFPDDKNSFMSVDTIWKAEYITLDYIPKDLKRRFGAGFFLEKKIKVDGRDALLYHIIPSIDRDEMRKKEDTWGVAVFCNKYGIAISHVAKVNLPIEDKIKNAKVPPKVLTDFLERFKCIDRKKK